MSEPTAERAIAAQPDPVYQRVVLDAEERPTDTPVPRPTSTICCYEWERDTLEVYARGMYGLDSWNEKYGYVLTTVNRYLNAEKNADGKPLYGSAQLTGIASNQSEYFFYSDHNPSTKENLDLANFMLNAAFTERLTCNYTGFAFPSNAVLFGYDSKWNPIVRSSRDAEPFYLNYNWKGVLP